jgi:DNA excision repair protein ERCC-3
MYVDQLQGIAAEMQAPIITGTTAQQTRDALYEEFRAGALPALVVSKVANFAIDLPDASLAIQISGTVGSRQEEAQRLGRILRPKPGDNQAHFYSVVTADTVEQDFALKRQLFLCEQGYEYEIADAHQLTGDGTDPASRALGQMVDPS